MGLETIKQLNVHYYNNHLSKFNIDQKLDLKFFNHNVGIKNNDVFIVPNQFNETSNLFLEINNRKVSDLSVGGVEYTGITTLGFNAGIRFLF